MVRISYIRIIWHWQCCWCGRNWWSGCISRKRKNKRAKQKPIRTMGFMTYFYHINCQVKWFIFMRFCSSLLLFMTESECVLCMCTAEWTIQKKKRIQIVHKIPIYLLMMDLFYDIADKAITYVRGMYRVLPHKQAAQLFLRTARTRSYTYFNFHRRAHTHSVHRAFMYPLNGAAACHKRSTPPDNSPNNYNRFADNIQVIERVSLAHFSFCSIAAWQAVCIHHQ